MAEVISSTGVVLVVDDDDLVKVSARTWSVNSRGYAHACFNYITVSLHRLVAGARPGQVVDHINGNRLDNRKANLRVCTQKENSRNKHRVKEGKLLPKGVTYDPRRSKAYRACIVVSGKKLSLGSFSTPEEAARAYNKAALFHFGEFACLNKETP